MCTPNALTTLEEYLVDYATPETRAIGETRTISETRAIGETRAISETHAIGETRAIGETLAIGETHAIGKTQAIGKTRAISEMRVIGGGANNEVWKRIIADICGVNLETGSDSDSITSLGVALAAAVGAGIYGSLDEAVRKVATVDRIVPDAATRGAYDEMYDKFIRLYPSVKHLY
jgi:xylulokinase